MADGIQDPKNQASLNALLAKLNAVSTELQGEGRAIGAQVQSEAAARNAATTEQQAVARKRNPGIIEDATSIKQGTAAIDERIAAETRLNALVERRVLLEREAAAATAAQTAVPAAQARYQAALTSQAFAEQQQLGARGAYATAIRSNAPMTAESNATNAALLGAREEANKQATLARQETTASLKDLEALQTTAATRTRIGEDLVALEVTTREEVAVAIKARDAAAYSARGAAARVQLAGNAVGGNGQLMLPAAGGTVGGASYAAEQQAAYNARYAAARVQQAGNAVSGSNQLLLPRGSGQLMLPPTGGTGAGRWTTPVAGSLSQTAGQAAAAERSLGGAFSSAASQEAVAITQMRAHGALTANFIGQLVKGNVTMRQFGQELGTTIGKFSGWVGAAAITYGALGAVVALGKGATETSSALQGMLRFLPGLDQARAARQLQGLAQETVTPINQVGMAAQQFAPIFKHLPAAQAQDATFAATRAALQASKLDNIGLADSYRYLTAITQEYGLTAAGLTTIFDQVTAAHDRLGAKVSFLLPAMAKSSAALLNARGTTDATTTKNDQIALESLALIRSGQPANTIGTGFARGAANMFNVTKQSISELAKVGIDPAQGFTSALKEAIGLAQHMSGGPKGPDITALSEAFFGKLRGGLLAPLFTTTPAALKTAGIQTSVGVDGLAAHQMAIVRGQINEQLKSFVINLEVIGSALSKSDLGAGFGTAARGIVGFTGDLGKLVNVFGGLNPIIKTAIEVMIAYKAAATFAHSTIGQQLGQLPGARTITNLVPGLRPSAGLLRDRQLGEIAGATVKELDNQMASQLGGIQRMKGTQATAATQVARLNAEIAACTEEELQTNTLIEDQAAAVATQKELLATRKVMESNLADTVAARTATQGVVAGVGPRTGKGGFSEAQRTATAVEYGVVTQSAIPVAENATLSAVAGARFTQAQLKVKVALARLTGSEVAVGVASEETAIGLDAARSTALASVPLLDAAEGSLRAMSTGMTAMISRFGGFNLALIAAMVALQVTGPAVADAQKGIKSVTDALKMPTDSFDAMAKAGVANTKLANNPPNLSVTNTPLGHLPNIPVISGIAQEIVNNFMPGGRGTVDTSGKAQLGFDLTRASNFNKAQAAQANIDAHSFAAGKESRSQFNLQMEAVRQLGGADYLKSSGVADAAIANYDKWVKTVLTPWVADNKKIGALTKKNPFAQFMALSSTNLEGQTQAYADRTRVYGAGGSGTGNFAQNIKAYATLAARFRNSTDPTELGKLATEQGLVVSAASKNATELLHAATLATTNKAQAGDIQGAIASDAQAEATIQRTIRQFNKEYKGHSAWIDAVRRGLNMVAGLIAEQTQTAIQAQQTQIKSVGDVRTSSIQGISPESDIARQRSDLQTLQSQLAAMKNTPADAQARNALIKSINDQQNAIVKSVAANARSLAEAAGGLAEASIGGTSPEADIARARAGLATDARLLAVDQANNAGPTAIMNDQKQLLNDQRALQASIVSNARGIIDSQQALAESKTNDPVAIARIQLAGAKRLLAFDQANNAGAKALIADQADINNKRKALATAALDAQHATIDFNASVGNINQSTELDQLNALLARMKRLHQPLAAVRSIEQEIYNIAHGAGAGVNLNVGNIKVPSVYEVRSALASGQRSRARATTRDALAQIHQDVKVNVIVSKNVDIQKMTDALGTALSTNVTGVAKAAGLI